MRIKEILVAGAAAVGLFAVMASGSSGDSSESRGTGVAQGASSAAADAGTAAPGATAAPTGAEADVAIAGCELDTTLASPVAHLTVTNNSSKSSSYFITVAFDSADGTSQIDTGIASVTNLLPGQSTSVDANSLKSDVAPGFVCKVAEVSRLAS